MKESGLRGALFEIIVLKLVLMSGYKQIDPWLIDGVNIKRKGKRILEFKGRGEYHQIDIPVDLIFQPNFIYPIRLLGETKYYNCKIDKSYIRAEIGKMKDIQENYFVSGLVSAEMRMKRRLEVFAFFAANGFNLGAERLAYAHGIKTISYENNECIRGVIILIDFLVDKLLKLKEADQNEFLDALYDILIFEKDSLDFEFLKCSQICLPLVIKTSIIGTTKTGLTINLLSYDDFPDYLFRERDVVRCRIRSSDNNNWYVEINETNYRMYFSMPQMVLEDAIERSGNVIYPRKAYEFESIFFEKQIDGINRKLELRFDNEWLQKLINNQ